MMNLRMALTAKSKKLKINSDDAFIPIMPEREK
jgi:hypothetical protein